MVRIHLIVFVSKYRCSRLKQTKQINNKTINSENLMSFPTSITGLVAPVVETELELAA